MSVADAAKFFKKSEDEIEKSLADSRRKLFEVRAKRPRPHLDDKVITAWNGRNGPDRDVARLVRTQLKGRRLDAQHRRVQHGNDLQLRGCPDVSDGHSH